jgi:hypothetical protein
MQSMSDVRWRARGRKAGVKHPVCMELKPLETYKTLLVEAPSEAIAVLTKSWLSAFCGTGLS